jgi:hypothetical protein
MKPRLLWLVIPAKAGIQLSPEALEESWIPAFAGMTSKRAID